MFYAKHLSVSLQDKLLECLSLDEAEQTSLLEDLALMRQTVLDIAQMYDLACAMYDAAISPETKHIALQNKIEAGQLMRNAQADLANLADKIEKHSQMRREQSGISVHAIGHITKQLVQLAYNVCGDNLTLAREFEAGAKAISLPDFSKGARGTMLTPDQDVMEMDATVPAEPADNANGQEIQSDV
jgi:hypothetical protein